MRNTQFSMKELVVGVALICCFLFMFRLWPLILLAILVGLILTIKQILLSKKTKSKENVVEPTIIAAVAEKDGWEYKYELAMETISCFVEEEYPNAKWVWEKSNWKELFRKDETLHIRLNKDGEYKRAKVALENGFVGGIEFLIEKEDLIIQPEQEIKAPKDDEVRIAYEWVETHLLELNERCNEVIGQGAGELMLSQCELPEEKYWEFICQELLKTGLEEIKILPGEGIKIILK